MLYPGRHDFIFHLRLQAPAREECAIGMVYEGVVR